MRALRVLMLPMALSLATALVAGCSNSAAPTETDQAQTGPLFAASNFRFHDDVDGATCTKWGDGWLRYPLSAFVPYNPDLLAATRADHNGNSYVCSKSK